MSTLQVDHNGNRIRTDILICGYLREEIEDKLKILIPSEIQKLCFVYWFIDICDEWDIASHTKKKIAVDKQTITTIERGYCSMMDVIVYHQVHLNGN